MNTNYTRKYLPITISWSLLKLMSIELVMPSNHLILCSPLLLLPPIPPSIRVFSNEKFLSKAPEAKVQEEKEKLATFYYYCLENRVRLSRKLRAPTRRDSRLQISHSLRATV